MNFHYFELNKSQVKEVIKCGISSYYFKLRKKPNDFRPVKVTKSTNITHMNFLYNKSYEDFLEYKLFELIDNKIFSNNTNYHVIFFRSITYVGELDLPIDEKITNKFETMKIFG